MTPRPRKRATLARYGQRGDQVRVLHDRKAERIEVHYRDRAGLSHKKIFEPTKDGRAAACAWAEAYHVERSKLATAGVPETSMRQLWQAYAASPDFRSLRKASKQTYTARYGLWMAFMGDDAVPARTTLADVDRFRTAMEAQDTKRGEPRSLNQVRQVINTVRVIYRWGMSRKLVASNDLALYRWKTPIDAVPIEPDEYRNDEYEALLAELSPQHPKRWRANVAIQLGGASGQRAEAIRHLRWLDVDFTHGVIVWPGKYQKQGKPLRRTITPEIRAALFTALHWREKVATGRERKRAKQRTSGATREALTSADWVLFAEHQRSKPVSYQTLHTQLLQAELRAKVPHLEFRALHGLRRMVVGDVGELTGDVTRGLEYVGDRDAKQRRSYDRRMQKRVDDAARLLSEKASLKRPSQPAADSSKTQPIVTSEVTE